MVNIEKFWSVVCDYEGLLRFVLTFLVFMLVLTSLTLLFGEPGTGSYVIAVVNLVMILFFGSIVGALYVGCIRRETRGRRE
ncbi:MULTISPECIES: hypothetical protein [Haloarcula]|uniref:hypothetical protein n=1 Tax=Haloarcula TaxID=2237 RepID=UPI0007BC627D|nr:MULTISPECIES: hypothetical protein [Haloarcula]KZX49077.1 hypothetical protein AV929_19555 [Haloarcula sp. K1]